MSPNPSNSPRVVIERWAGELLRDLEEAATDGRVRARVATTTGGLACLVQVWPARDRMPTATEERRIPGSRRARCRADVVAVLTAAGRALTRKEVVRALKEAKAVHGVGTVAKALAELTASGELVNTRDKRGYRLPAWVRQQPSLFSESASLN